MRVAFKNFGCRTNVYETDVLTIEALRRGFEVVTETEKADFYVINSCTVTSNADRDARRQVQQFKRVNPSARVAVIGCYAQVARKELLNNSAVDYVVGTADKLRVLDLITQEVDRDQVANATGFLPEHFVGSRHSRANIKVQDGCNYRCAFCTIPRARGRSRSLPPVLVEGQVREAGRLGFEEVVLTGIHLAHYGWEHNCDLKDLIERLICIPDVPRIRLSTLDPFEIPAGLLDLMTTSSKICPFLHIALQSGDDRILQRMRRLYEVQEFSDVTAQIAARMPSAFIGVDVIVGFPGEDASAFERTCDFLKSTAWSRLHVFSFSERRGTEAAMLDGKVDGKEISMRSRCLREMSDERYARFLKSQVGHIRQLLLERPVKQKEGTWTGHTENYIPVEVKWHDAEARKIVPVKLTSAGRSSADGEVLL